MLTRRLFLKAGGIALFTLGTGRARLPDPRRPGRRGTGSPSRRRKVLVTIFQRGAMDGLAAVPPLATRRPSAPCGRASP